MARARGFSSGVSVRFDADRATASLARLHNRFATSQSALRNAHFEAAETVAADAHDLLETRIAAAGFPGRARRREQRGSNYLLKAVVHPDNYRADRFGMGVGFESFLNSPANRVNFYWREIEEGSTAHLGDRVPIGQDFLPLKAQGYTKSPRGSVRGYARIENAFSGYHFYRDAGKKVTKKYMLDLYDSHFKSIGLDFASLRGAASLR